MNLFSILEYIRSNVQCKLINISLGICTGENIDVLSKLCYFMMEKGVVIVSAFSNWGCYSYPAAFDCVIGVDSLPETLAENSIVFVENSPINILAKGGIQRVLKADGSVLITSGNSIACAHITSLIYKEFNGDYNRKNVLDFLKKKSEFVIKSQEKQSVRKKMFETQRAIVFPVSKEMHAFVRFSELLSFTIVDFYDVRQSGKVGRSLGNVCHRVDCKEKIKNIDNISFDGIDTIILGHLDKLDATIKTCYKDKIIREAIKAKVNIFSFDLLDEYLNLLKSSDICFYYPGINRADLPENSFGKLYKISKPVIGIFGTSSCQGKFSLQLTLKKEFEKRGYNVGTIGTEPHSLLFGFDADFPMGFNSNIKLGNKEIVTYLNNTINALCQNGKELILTASQTQFIPFYCNNLSEYPSLQYHFILGTKPDVVLLCINYYDDIEYITCTVNAIEGMADTVVIGLVMFPMTFSDGWISMYSLAKREISFLEYLERKKILEEKINIPVYLLGEEKCMQDICEKVIAFF